MAQDNNNEFSEKTEQQPQTSMITPPMSPVSNSKRISSLKVTAGQTGLPWLAHDGENSPIDSPQSPPPPKFTARPRRISTLRFPTRKRTMQKHIYKMDDGLSPVKVLIQRLKNWQTSVQYILKMFTSIKKAESSSGNSYRKIDTKFVFPTKIKDQFKSSHGVQDAWFAFRQYTRENSLVHRDFVDFIENEIIPILKTMLKDIQHMMHSIKSNKDLRTAYLWDCRKKADKIITRLNSDVYLAVKNQEKTNSPYFNTKRDPILTKYAVIQTIKTLYKEENRLHQHFVDTQDKYRQFEQDKIVNVYTDIFQTFDTYRTQHHLEALEGVSKVAAIFNAIEADSEWKDFVQRHDSELVNPSAAYKDENHLDFPNCSHPFVQPLIATNLQKHHKKKWAEAFYLLSPVGLLYRYASEEALLKHPHKPDIKLFVPQCTMLIHPASQLFQLKGKLLNSFFKSKVTYELSASDLNTVKHVIQVLAPIVIQKETSHLDNVTPPEQQTNEEKVEQQAVLPEEQQQADDTTNQEEEIKPITNHNKDAVEYDDDDIQQAVEYSTHSPQVEGSSDKTTTGPSTPTGATELPPPIQQSTNSIPKIGGPTRNGSDIFWDTA